MRSIIYLTLTLLIQVVIVDELNAQEVSASKTNKEIIKSRIDSIVSANYKLRHIVATDYDSGIPEGIFGYYSFDSAENKIQAATIFSYKNKIKTLTNYYFFNEKLIALHEISVPFANQTSSKLNKSSRFAWYWQDSFIDVEQESKNKFEVEADLLEANKVLARFENKQKAGKLVF